MPCRSHFPAASDSMAAFANHDAASRTLSNASTSTSGSKTSPCTTAGPPCSPAAAAINASVGSRRRSVQCLEHFRQVVGPEADHVVGDQAGLLLRLGHARRCARPRCGRTRSALVLALRFSRAWMSASAVLRPVVFTAVGLRVRPERNLLARSARSDFDMLAPSVIELSTSALTPRLAPAPPAREPRAGSVCSVRQTVKIGIRRFGPRPDLPSN